MLTINNERVSNNAMSDKQRLNLTVDGDVPALLEQLANGRNKMGDYLSKIVRSLAEGTPAEEIERMDTEALRLMVQGLAGRVKSVEGEIIHLRSQVAAQIADRSA